MKTSKDHCDIVAFTLDISTKDWYLSATLDISTKGWYLSAYSTKD